MSKERYEEIKKIINTRGKVRVDRLIKEINASRATIYRDLEKMKNEGIVAVNRGIVSKPYVGAKHESGYMAKVNYNAAQKERIAIRALSYITAGASVFMDSSTTVTKMTEYMDDINSLQVLTNDIMISSMLTNYENVKVIVTGGELREGYYSLTGNIAKEMIDKFKVDVAFMSCDAVGMDGELMITNLEEEIVKKAAMDFCEKLILMCDSSKFGKDAFVSIGNIKNVDTVITGREINKDCYDKLVYEGINIVKV